MATRTTTVASSVGLHARPAALFAKAAGASGQKVSLTAGGRTVDAASILGIMSLQVQHGAEVTIEVEGEAAERVADELQEMLETDLDAA